MSQLLVAPPIFAAMPNTDNEDIPALIYGIDDDMRLDRMNSYWRRDFRTLTGSVRIFRQKLKRLLQQVVIALRLLNTELRRAIHEGGDDVLFGLST